MARRAHQRYPADLPVLMRVVDGGETLEVWLKDLSLGGAFVVTGRDLASRCQVELLLDHATLGALCFPAQVVHRVSPEQAELWGAAVGIGLRFVELEATVSRQLDDLLTDLRARLDRDLEQAAFDTGLLAEVEAAQRKGSLHDVLGLPLEAAAAAVNAALQDRIARLDEVMALDGLDDGLRRRLIAARLAVQRAGDLLGNDRQRAIYLLRGELLPAAQIAVALADAPEGLQEAENYWEGHHSLQVSEARALAESARAAAAGGERSRARELAAQVLGLHPFWQDFRVESDGWAHSSPTPQPGDDPGAGQD